MNFEEFLNNSWGVLKPGKVFNNPGSGTSTVISVGENVYYQRGSSSIKAPLDEFYKAYKSFKGKVCSTKDLKAFTPNVFDSSARPAGHSCNCTFLFILLHEMNLSSEIKGKGVVGSPFYVTIY